MNQLKLYFPHKEIFSNCTDFGFCWYFLLVIDYAALIVVEAVQDGDIERAGMLKMQINVIQTPVVLTLPVVWNHCNCQRLS